MLLFFPPQSCEFVKKRDETVLRVVWNGAMRLFQEGSKTGTCRRWFFTLNGKECSDPKTIDTQMYIRVDNVVDLNRVAFGRLEL